jgi:hypothetical protein
VCVCVCVCDHIQESTQMLYIYIVPHVATCFSRNKHYQTNCEEFVQARNFNVKPYYFVVSFHIRSFTFYNYSCLKDAFKSNCLIWCYVI